MPEKGVLMRSKQNQTLGGSAVMPLFLWGWFRKRESGPLTIWMNVGCGF